MIPVKIKPDKYGEAILFLIRRGGGFQTRFEDLLIVNPEQRRALEKAGYVASNGTESKSRKSRGAKAK
jgi:hypothetical protein